MFEELNTISENFQLWKKAKTHAIKCLENYSIESIFIDFPMLSKVNITDFILTKKNQSLLFRNNGDKTYIIRTVYIIDFKNEIKSINGYYYFDTDENGKFIDEWFVIK